MNDEEIIRYKPKRVSLQLTVPIILFVCSLLLFSFVFMLLSDNVNWVFIVLSSIAVFLVSLLGARNDQMKNELYLSLFYIAREILNDEEIKNKFMVRNAANELISNRFEQFDRHYWLETYLTVGWPRPIPLGDYYCYYIASYAEPKHIQLAKNNLPKFNQRKFESYKIKANVFLGQFEKNILKRKRLAEISDTMETSILDSMQANKQIFEQEQEKERKQMEEFEQNSTNKSYQFLTGKCPYCFNKISRMARKCPNCTADL